MLRVEPRVFLVVNDEGAGDFGDHACTDAASGTHQSHMLPTGTGDPALLRGSTTGPRYDQMTCSPVEVMSNVRPNCERLSAQSIAT